MNFEVKVVIRSSGEHEVVHLENEKIIGYELQDGDILVDLGSYNDFIKPKWNGMEWIEGATQEEIDELNYIPSQQPSVEDYLLDLDFRLSMMELGL